MRIANVLCAECADLVLRRREAGSEIDRATAQASRSVAMCPFCGRLDDCRCADWQRVEQRITELHDRIGSLQRDIAILRSEKVYVLRSLDDPSIAKIGTGVQPEERAQYWSDQTGHRMQIIGWMVGGRDTERHLHSLFDADRVRLDLGREFFRFTQRLQRYIDDLFDTSDPVGYVASPTGGAMPR